MAAITIEQLYEQHIKPMPATEQLQLVTIITKQLATWATIEELPQHSSSDPAELEAEIEKSVDAQNLPATEAESESDWRTEWEELAQKVSAAWKSDKGAVETLIEMRR